jgi:hypothetical protein
MSPNVPQIATPGRTLSGNSILGRETSANEIGIRSGELVAGAAPKGDQAFRLFFYP